MTFEERQSLLKVIHGQKAVAENELRFEQGLGWFYPSPLYERAHETDNFLILGGRGSGKTALFQVMTRFETQIQQMYRNAYKEGTIFIKGFDTEGQDFPTEQVIKAHIDINDSDQINAFWLGLLVYSLLTHFQDDASVLAILASYLGEGAIVKIKEAATNLFWINEVPIAQISNALDALDRAFDQRNVDVYVLYDYLDRVFIQEYNSAVRFASSLLALWLNRVRRWRHIRTKIFLRKDIFNHAKTFPDASKLNGYSADLDWTAVQLYSMWIKRFANTSEQALQYCRAMDGLIKPERSAALGYEPVDDPDAQKVFIHHLVGQYMGASAKKGYTYPWIVDKVSDAQGIALPRSFIKFFTQAADWMLDNQDAIKKLSENKLLIPKAFTNALDTVSTERIDELKEEYGDWIANLRIALSDMMLPATKEEIINRISRDEILKQDGTYERMLSLLLEIGIMEERVDKRISMPWIYRRGFGVKTRGGVAR